MKKVKLLIDADNLSACKLFSDLKKELTDSGIKFVNVNEFEYDEQSDEAVKVKDIVDKYYHLLDQY